MIKNSAQFRSRLTGQCTAVWYWEIKIFQRNKLLITVQREPRKRSEKGPHQLLFHFKFSCFNKNWIQSVHCFPLNTLTNLSHIYMYISMCASVPRCTYTHTHTSTPTNTHSHPLSTNSQQRKEPNLIISNGRRTLFVLMVPLNSCLGSMLWLQVFYTVAWKVPHY